MPSERIGSLEEWARNLNRAVYSELRTTAQETADDLGILLTAVTRSWQNQLSWQVRSSVSPDLIVGEVIAVGRLKARQIFNWIDQGTGLHGPKKRAYKIPKYPKPNSLLTFRTGYQPKTLPIARFNQGPGQATGNWVSVKEVTHPGIRSREFIKTFIEELQPPFSERVLVAFTRAGRRAAN